ncbi:hypothetical protein Lbru_1513 [Legionella brunensis]|uniref:Uncharacterized protein n=1 Tax=Legionella brunensis TaxID=29422 RepID=A0A0W0SLC0_9GAMM|nr:hypothetical protein Lbru_1513 [Legionella brunensis]
MGQFHIKQALGGLCSVEMRIAQICGIPLNLSIFFNWLMLPQHPHTHNQDQGLQLQK